MLHKSVDKRKSNILVCSIQISVFTLAKEIPAGRARYDEMNGNELAVLTTQPLATEIANLKDNLRGF